MQTTGVQSSYERKEFSLGSMKEEQENDEDDNVDKIQLLKKPYEKNLEDQTPQENNDTSNPPTLSLLNSWAKSKSRARNKSIIIQFINTNHSINYL